MQPPQERPDAISLWTLTEAAGSLSGRWLRGATGDVRLDALRSASSVGAPRDGLRGRSVLLSTRHQLEAALALIELDGIAKRVVLCPPDLAAHHHARIIVSAEIDLIVCDEDAPAGAGTERIAVRSDRLAPLLRARETGERTEWILPTGGTTGPPKLVQHTLASLIEPMAGRTALGSGSLWSTFYDIRRYGGLQIFLRAMLGGGSIVLSSASESTASFLARAGALGVTHISGTPSHWRRALMSPPAEGFAPRYIRLSGEIADQSVLDQLRAAFPGSGIAHAFASTEAGVGFEVTDGLAGFPASFLGRHANGVEVKVEDGSLKLRSARTASRYLGNGAPALRDPGGFVDTGDMVELRAERYYFAGRRDGGVNIGGLKVLPEEIEAVINGHPKVRMCRVKARRSPITGAIVAADVVARSNGREFDADEAGLLRNEIIAYCSSRLARHKVPAVIRFVPSLELTASGKVGR